MWGGEGHVSQLGKEEPLLRSDESRGRGSGENREMHAVMSERVSQEGERLGECGLFRERWQFPQTTPACSGLLFEQNAAACHNPRAILAEGDGLGARLLDGKEFGIARAAFLYNPDNSPDQLQLAALERAAVPLGITVVRLGVRKAQDYDSAFAEAKAKRADALMIVSSPNISAPRNS